MDVKILRLKRWNLPQAKSIADIVCMDTYAQNELPKDGSVAEDVYSSRQEKLLEYGKYISFNNYHFWDVLSPEENSIQGAYTAIRESRKKHQGTEIHVIQSMVLLGNIDDKCRESFWRNSTILYASMLQLTNTTDVDYLSLEAQIKKAFKENDIFPDKWCLYYSLDFCDAVIFAKDVPLNDYQHVLWEVTLNITNSSSANGPQNASSKHFSFCDYPDNMQGNRYIRDTVTIYGIEANYLANKFRDFKSSFVLPNISEATDIQHTKLPTNYERALCFINKTSEKICISVELSIQSAKRWNTFLLMTNPLKPQIKRALGRYDVQLVFDNITLDEALFIAYWIHDPSTNPYTEAFGEYRIIPYTIDNKQYTGEEINLNTSFSETVSKAFDIIFKEEPYRSYYRNCRYGVNDSEQTSASILEYGIEFKRSLMALLKQSFSEEFGISMLHSFMEYLQVIKDNHNIFLTNKSDCKKLIDFQREYFQGINMLMHCTMHSEKQFIQAPAFNPVICDVPPKLLAFYSGIAYAATELLNDESPNRFSFLFVPDFREDIYVKPISFGGPRERLISIINLNEQLFYNPCDVIPLVCHEVAHYVGNNCRNRKLRALELFDCLGAYMIYYVLPISSDDTELRYFVALISSTFSEEVLKAYLNWFHNHECVSSDSFYLSDILKFVEQTSALSDLLFETSFINTIVSKCCNALSNSETPEVHDLLHKIIQKMDKRLYTTYLENMHSCDSTMHMSVETVIRQVFSEIVSGIRDNNDRIYLHYQFFRNIALCFSEAYADLKMNELLSEENNDCTEFLVNYIGLSRYIPSNADDNTLNYSLYCRTLPVCKVLGLEEPAHILPADINIISKACLEYTQDRVISYLSKCHYQMDVNPLNQELKQRMILSYKNLKSDDAAMQSLEIRKTIVEYRNKLEKYCLTL